jgi:hypothetical protein
MAAFLFSENHGLASYIRLLSLCEPFFDFATSLALV